jgi:organic hydroperoxide reductase OsmC/OhrA
MIEKALQLHANAHTHCFIANSVNFEVRVEAKIICE